MMPKNNRSPRIDPPIFFILLNLIGSVNLPSLKFAMNMPLRRDRQKDRSSLQLYSKSSWPQPTWVAPLRKNYPYEIVTCRGRGHFGSKLVQVNDPRRLTLAAF